MDEADQEPAESSASNEVVSHFNMKNYHCISTRNVNETPLLACAKVEGGREFVTAIDLDQCKKAELVAKERRWVGTIVTKIFDGERYMGNVIEFDEETGWFQIVYEGGKREAVCKEELRLIVSPPQLVCEYLNRIEARKNEKKRKKMAAAAAKASSSLDKRMPRQSKQPKTKGLKCKKIGNSAQNHAPYVPLAIKEKKKDAYIWY